MYTLISLTCTRLGLGVYLTGFGHGFGLGFGKKQARREGGKRADCPRVSYSEGPQIVRALFLRIPQSTLKALISNEVLFGAGGWGWMTTLPRVSCCLSAGLVKSTDCLSCISTSIYVFYITENSNPILGLDYLRRAGPFTGPAH